jgi:hypothetical protein
MSSSRGPAALLSGGQLSFRFWDFGIGSGPNSSANFDVQTGGLIDELEWVRTDISAFDSWKFVNHATQRAALNAIENSSVVPVPCRQN